MSADTSKPCIKYLRGRTTTPSSGRTTTPTFGMIPAEVLFDQRMRHEDIRGYCVMAYFRDGPKVNTGQRRLAEATGVDRRTMRRIIGRLVEFGHVTVKQSGKWRADYRLISPLFCKQFPVNAIVDEQLEEIDVKKPVPKICPLCHKKRRGLMSLGWCRSCNSQKNMERISEKTARRVVREEIGKTA